ncbi:hypothetical protein TSUD_202570 [Trifolium subterraneum]|uniref:Cullin N-terminal domain-containing protein n=1 Tax=Trifolium subterraneum TaxID=3900 RepID=A0A2Z6M817_TRISU|nr:hypothetical protein TSUD_202570 [Trifolium subterraneum]
MSARKIMKFEEGWEILKKGIEKLQNIVEGLNEPNFTSAYRMLLYTTVYNLCIKKPYYTVEMYEKYKETCEEYIRSKVYEGMNKEITDAILAMMGRKLAEEMIDQTFVNTLVFYLRFYNWTKEVDTTKNINLISYDGDVFEVDYGLTLKLKRFEEITRTISLGRTDAIYVPKVSGKMLGMVVEYYKKHKNANKSELMDWDAQFVDVDPKTLLDLATTARYMKIVNLDELTWSKVGELIKGKTPEEIGQIFGAVDDLDSKLLEAD